jgi:hypothetical protein
MNDQEIDKIISDELLRSRIEKLANSPKKEFLNGFFSHPLVLLICGFLATGVLGNRISNKFSENQSRVQELKAKKENGIPAINKIAELMNQRYTATTLLASAIKRNAPLDEIKARKAIYDDSYIRWNTSLLVTQLTIRALTIDTVYSKIESKLQTAYPLIFRSLILASLMAMMPKWGIENGHTTQDSSGAN